jgi:hypothetical protein
MNGNILCLRIREPLYPEMDTKDGALWTTVAGGNEGSSSNKLKVHLQRFLC